MDSPSLCSCVGKGYWIFFQQPSEAFSFIVSYHSVR